jgi:asparaginyl-tRNA synthetase
VQGFVRSVRKQKHFAFAEITDGSTIQSLQAVLTPDQASRYFYISISSRHNAIYSGEGAHED